MSQNPPPLLQPIITKPDGSAAGGLSLLWALFFNQIFQGDAGVKWTPTIQNLGTSNAAPTTTGQVYKISQYLTYFRFTIIPAQGGTTTSTVQKTYVDNFPYVMSGNGICGSVASQEGGSLGMCEKATGKIWLPAWNTSADVTIIGMVEAS